MMWKSVTSTCLTSLSISGMSALQTLCLLKHDEERTYHSFFGYCCVLIQLRGIPSTDTDLAENGLRATLQRIWGVLVDVKFNMSQQSMLAAQKNNSILGCIKRRSAGWGKWLCTSALLSWEPVEYCIQFWVHQHKKEMEMLEQVQRTAMKIIRGLKNLPSEDRLKEMGLCRLEKKRLWGTL